MLLFDLDQTPISQLVKLEKQNQGFSYLSEAETRVLLDNKNIS